MTEKIRVSREGDEDTLKKLWKTVFGDSDEYISGFFHYMYQPGRALCVEAGGDIVSMAFSLPVGELIVPGVGETPCSYIYGVATAPEYRSRGYGALVTKVLADNCECGVAALRPAEPSLFRYYGERTGFSTFFRACERRVSTRSGLPEAAGSADELNASGYLALREPILEGTSHVAFSERAMLYQEHLCKASGGGLFSLRLPNGNGIIAVEMRGGEIFVKELLCSAGDDAAAAALIASLFPQAEYITLRTPVKISAPSGDFAMVKPFIFLPSGGPPPWFGFVFD